MPYYRRGKPGGDLGRAIRAIRRRENLSQAELGQRIGGTQGLIAAYELGKTKPTAVPLIQLLKLANTDSLRAPIMRALVGHGLSEDDVCKLSAAVSGSIKPLTISPSSAITLQESISGGLKKSDIVPGTEGENSAQRVENSGGCR